MILNNYDDHFHMMDFWFNLFGPFWWIFMILGWIIFIGSSILIAYYVHKDALKRGIDNAEIWLIISLVFNVIGLLIYLLVRSNYKDIQSTNKQAEIRG
jgi:Na+-driven multidrug efflux pump